MRRVGLAKRCFAEPGPAFFGRKQPEPRLSSAPLRKELRAALRPGNETVPKFVMAGLVPAIHVLQCLKKQKTWMPGTNPGMTTAGGGSMKRRDFIKAAAGAAALWPAAVRAQTFPSRSITLIVPFAAGGPTDVLARILAEH